jgi:hypothetical protein
MDECQHHILGFSTTSGNPNERDIDRKQRGILRSSLNIRNIYVILRWFSATWWVLRHVIGFSTTWWDSPSPDWFSITWLILCHIKYCWISKLLRDELLIYYWPWFVIHFISSQTLLFYLSILDICYLLLVYLLKDCKVTEPSGDRINTKIINNYMIKRK